MILILKLSQSVTDRMFFCMCLLPIDFFACLVFTTLYTKKKNILMWFIVKQLAGI